MCLSSCLLLAFTHTQILLSSICQTDSSDRFQFASRFCAMVHLQFDGLPTKVLSGWPFILYLGSLGLCVYNGLKARQSLFDHKLPNCPLHGSQKASDSGRAACCAPVFFHFCEGSVSVLCRHVLTCKDDSEEPDPKLYQWQRNRLWSQISLRTIMLLI